jgi:hypothetical protein
VPNAFDILLKKGAAPASVVVGSRRSARTSRPSAKLREAQDGGLQSAVAAGKRKVRDSSSESQSRQRRIHRRTSSAVLSDDEGGDTEPAETIDNDSESDTSDAGFTLDELRAMDNTASVCLDLMQFSESLLTSEMKGTVSKLSKTEDVRTMFTVVDEVDSTTGKAKKTHLCTFCR